MTPRIKNQLLLLFVCVGLIPIAASAAGYKNNPTVCTSIASNTVTTVLLEKHIRQNYMLESTAGAPIVRFKCSNTILTSATRLTGSKRLKGTSYSARHGDVVCTAAVSAMLEDTAGNAVNLCTDELY